MREINEQTTGVRHHPSFDTQKILTLEKRVTELETELRCCIVERDRAMMACEQLCENFSKLAWTQDELRYLYALYEVVQQVVEEEGIDDFGQLEIGHKNTARILTALNECSKKGSQILVDKDSK